MPPVTEPDVPVGQGEQMEAPVEFEYEPGAHGGQEAVPVAANDPGLHAVHVSAAAWPVVGEAVPTGQSVGAAAPAGQKAPAGQTVQVAKPEPEK